MKQTAVVTVPDLGPGLEQSPVTELVQVQISADPGNAVQRGSDNGLWAPTTEGWPVVEQDPATAALGVPWLLETTVNPEGAVGTLLAGFGSDILVEPIAPVLGFLLSVKTNGGIARTTLVLDKK